MKRARKTAVAFALGCALGALAPHAVAKGLDPATADEVVSQARKEGIDAFCQNPRQPLTLHARSLCPLAKDVSGCEGFAKACSLDLPTMHMDPVDAEWGKALSMIANVLVWLMVAGVVGVLAYFVVQAVLRARRDRAAHEEPRARQAQVLAMPPADPLAEPTEAEVLLRRADEHASRGELERAAALYLAAALRALDRRGAIRIARHRTNGEYVRSCTDPEAKPELRAIVREVDRVQYGHEALTLEAARTMGSRATAIVGRAAVAILGAALLLGGCTDRGPDLRASNPGGDDLLFELLKRQGTNVSYLGGSLATLPMPRESEKPRLVFIDAERVPLEEETRAHLARWVEAGGHLLLLGNLRAWPESFAAKRHSAESADVTVPSFVEEEDGDEDAPANSPSYAAHVAEPAALEWPESVALATTGDKERYAAVRGFEKGYVVGVASDDLFTNTGLARAPNAAAAAQLLARYVGEGGVAIARPEDGIPPPSNPITSLLHAGLGLALAHAAAAGLVLFAAFGLRQARPRKRLPPARRAWTEHIEATGGVYARAKLAPHALAAYARFVDGRLRGLMPRGAQDPAAFLAMRAKADPAWCADVWARASAARSADRPRGDELATLRALSALFAAATGAEG